MRSTLIVSDLQVPYQHVAAVRSLSKFIHDWQPDDVVCVGDVCDFPSVSRWNRGLAGEYDVSLGEQRDEAVEVLKKLKVKHLSRSNHDERVEIYIRQKAPALDGLDDLKIERFLRLDELGITFHRKPYEFAPGWWLMHGDEGGLCSDPGKTAVNLAKKVGASVAVGHTHRLGIQPFTESVGGQIVRVRYGMETGCLMDMTKADYIMQKGGSANWQLGFGIVFTDRKGRSLPIMVPMEQDGSFIWDGKVWR